MKRILLSVALAAAAFVPAPASAAIGPEPCGDTFQPECDICLEDTWQNRICVPFTLGSGS